MTEDAPSTYVLPSSDAESQRLEQQALLYGGVGVFEPFLAESPRAVLDAGCGTGHFTRHVAARLPAAAVTGLDLDEPRLAFARERCARENVSFVRGDLAALPFPDGHFDLVFCRFVLVHDRDPRRALREMARVTRPGGRVVAYDMVHSAIWFVPDRPAFADVLARVVAILRARGAEPDQGLHLATGMRRAGLDGVAVRVIPHHALAGEPLYDAYRANWQATFASLAEALGPALADAPLAKAQSELARTDGDELLLETTVLAWARRP